MPVKFDVSGAVKAAERLSEFPRKMETATKRAVSSTSRSLPAEAKRAIQDRYNLKSRRITESLAVRSTGDAIELTGYDRPTGLLQYGARASKKSGVTVSVIRSSGPTKLRHAFAATGLSGNKQIFERKGAKRVMTKGKYIGERRQPLVAIYGPSVGQALRNKDIQARLGKFALEKLAFEINRQIGIL